MAALKLISHKLCPYVQRAVIALTEKGVPFERIDIDLANKPDWFLKLSPLGKVIALTEKGVPFERIVIDLANKPDWFLKLSSLCKVPVLVVERDGREVALFESNVICEYIEDTISE